MFNIVKIPNQILSSPYLLLSYYWLILSIKREAEYEMFFQREKERDRQTDFQITN